MRAWILEKQAKIEERPLKLVEVPTPRPQDSEMRVKVLVCGVCRTDIHIAEGDLPLRESPVILGHEIGESLMRWGRTSNDSTPVTRLACIGCTAPADGANTVCHRGRTIVRRSSAQGGTWMVATRNI